MTSHPKHPMLALADTRTRSRTRASLPRMALALGAWLWCGSVVACSGSDRAPATSHRTTGSTDTRASGSASLRVSTLPGSDTIAIAGTATDAADHSAFTAYAIGGQVVRIDETSAAGTDDRYARSYAFDERGRLVHMSEDKSMLVSNSNASPTPMHVNLSLDWADGVATRSSKRVDGAERAVQPWDIDNAKRHADLLVSLARPGLPPGSASPTRAP